MKLKETELIKRWKTKSPKFFKRLKVYALSIGISCIAMSSVNKIFELNIEHTIITICNHVAFTCAGIAGTSKLTKDDTPPSQ